MTEDYVFRAAISTSNIACLLMQHQCYNQANQTLRDAVAILRHIESTSMAEAGRSLVDSKLRDATKRLVYPEPLHSIDVSKRIKVLSDECSVAQATSASSSSSFCELHPIRIDSYDLETEEEDLISAIIIYNLGISYLLRSKLSPNSNASKMQANALKVFRLSQNLLSACLDDSKIMINVLVVSVIVSRAISQCHSNGHVEEVSYNKLDSLVQAAKVVEERLEASVHVGALAPAA